MRLWLIAYLGSSGSEVEAWRQRHWPGRGRGPTAQLRAPLTSTPQCREIANNLRELRRLGISHVLNASHSRWRGTPEAYVGLGIRYLGVEAHDSPAFDMSVHFQAAADFIHRALSQPGGKRGARRREGPTDNGLENSPGVWVWRERET